jgi:hypothetical protein
MTLDRVYLRYISDRDATTPPPAPPPVNVTETTPA